VSFSAATVTHSFENADATAASGSVQFTLTGAMTNGTTTIVPASVTANLNNSGVLSQSLTSNVDTGTVPAAPSNTQWRVDLRILGAQEESFFIVVPTGGGTVDLFSLIPSAQQVG
jgi:hypothetical protein